MGCNGTTKERYITYFEDGAEQTPHPDSGAAEEARKLGLQYYGFGRYGKNGQVTHRSVHDRLVEVDKEQPKEPNIPAPGTSMKKKVNEEFQKEFGGLLSESVTISITGDTVDEVHSMISSIQGYSLEVEETDSGIELSDTNESLTLGKKVQTIGEKQEELVVTNDDLQSIFEEKKVKLLRDKSGKPRIFLLRRGAAKEAHIRGGEVMKHPKGYVIKIKEEIENDSIFQESIWNETTRTNTRETSIGWSNSSSGREDLQMASTARTLNEHCGCETGSRDDITGTSTSASGREASASATKTENAESTQETKASKSKITLAKIKENFKQKVSESIDKGIETGISMAGAGESLGRDMGEKINKKGKATPVREMGGDETGASIGDQKEDELKKKGISLTTFKKRNYL